jgi:hypothetical protein
VANADQADANGDGIGDLCAVPEDIVTGGWGECMCGAPGREFTSVRSMLGALLGLL